MDKLRIFLFGMPRLEIKGKPVKIKRRKGLALAAYLALAEQRQTRETLASLFWPELDHEHARSALRSTLHSLTSSVPLTWVDSDAMTVAIQREMVDVDVNAFLDLLHQRVAHGHQRDFVCVACVDLYRQAIELYQADFMAGFNPSYSEEFDDWQRSQRQWLRWEFADIHRQLSEYFGWQGHFQLGIKHANQWLSLDPLHEHAHRQLMRLHYANGERSEALRQFESCAKILADELAALPDIETRQLYDAIQSEQLEEGFFVNPADRSAVKSVLPQLPALVIGRKKELDELKLRIGVKSPEWRAITVIQGWPGVGKSTLLATLAHDPEVNEKFPDGILWASLGESPNLLGELSAWADVLLPGKDSRSRNLQEVSLHLTAVLRDRRVLLILDDVWQIEHALPFRIGGQYCAFVMTSRLNDVSTALAPTAGDVYRLPVLSEEAGLELLGELTPETLIEEPIAARELVRDLEGLPLAIHVAGRLLHSEARLGWGLRELLDELRSGAALLAAPAPTEMQSGRHGPSPTVTALLKRSTDLLDSETRRRFSYLGLFVPKPATFDLEAMAIAWEVEDPRVTARQLVNRGLLEPVSRGRFQMHALLVIHARSLMEMYVS
jgi:DNA-binding SARP family transcriptional activator